MDCYWEEQCGGSGSSVIVGKKSPLQEVSLRFKREGDELMKVELSSLVAVSILYMATRHRVPTGAIRSPTTPYSGRPGSPGLINHHGTQARERSNRMSHSTHTQTSTISNIREDLRRISPPGGGSIEEVAEPKGAVWGTEAREYR
jgi:hypothetical protein